jgi:2-dehydropantoate 2-reductase
MTTSLLIVGSGAMACLFAGRLAASGVEVTMLGSWIEGLRALRERGVRLQLANGEEISYPVRVVTSPSECTDTKFALVLVKSWQTARAAKQLASCLESEGLALTLQNGLNNRQSLANVLKPQRVALGVTTTGATLVEPGLIRPVGDEVITLGVHSRLKPLSDMLRSAGFVVDTVADTSALLWGKLVINASINPLTALLRVTNGELLVRKPARNLMGITARETAAVAVARGIRLPYPDPVVAVETIARRTAENYSSMLRDVIRGAPTEIDSINGAIVNAGEETNVPTPVNRTLWQLIKAQGQS